MTRTTCFTGDGISVMPAPERSRRGLPRPQRMRAHIIAAGSAGGHGDAASGGARTAGEATEPPRGRQRGLRRWILPLMSASQRSAPQTGARKAAGKALRIAFAVAAVAALGLSAAAEAPLNVGSKRFTESYILGEILTQTAQGAGEASAAHRQGLGNTAIVLGALTQGSIDVYPEYTGTIAKEILKLDAVPSLPELNTKLAAMGLGVAVPLGFNNTYALAMRADDARAKGIAKLSDLRSHPELKLGLSQEFIGRADGWPGLKRAYELPYETPRGLDHGIAYEAIAAKQVDAIDIYSTDAKIDKYGLTVLADDRNYFPRYDAVLLYRADLPQRLPKTWAALDQLAGTIDDAAMRRMNAAAELDGKDFASIAAAFVVQRAGRAAKPGAATQRSTPDGFWRKLFAADFGRLTLEHLGLVFVSLAASIVVGIPLGIVAARHPAIEGAVLGATAVVQTIPSLALLAILIPLTGR